MVSVETAGITDLLVWPLLVAFIIFRFRKEFASAVRSFGSLKWGRAEGTFGAEVKEVAAIASGALPNILKTKDTGVSRVKILIALADIEPKEAIDEAWRDLGLAVDLVLLGQTGEHPQPKAQMKNENTNSALRAVVTNQQWEVYVRLRSLHHRAQAVEEYPSSGAAAKYVVLAHSLSACLESFIKPASKSA